VRAVQKIESYWNQSPSPRRAAPSHQSAGSDEVDLMRARASAAAGQAVGSAINPALKKRT